MFNNYSSDTLNEKEILERLNALGKESSVRFVIPDNKKKLLEETSVHVEPSHEVEKGLSDDKLKELENKRVVESYEKTIKLLEMAINHVRVYDSLETAEQIVNKAYYACPSVFIKRMVSDTNKSLKAAIKADKWAKTKRRARHVDESTVRRNIDTFYEKIADTVSTIKVDLDKRNNKFFTSLKDRYASDLPIFLPKTKSHIRKRASIVAMCLTKPDAKVDCLRLEGNLFLIKNAMVVGVNKNEYKFTIDKAIRVANKLGSTLYNAILSRPTDNIDWYLILDFGVGVTYASFADSMHVENDSVTSYEEYHQQQEKQARINQTMKNERLKNVRAQFIDENEAVVKDLQILQGEVDNLVFDRQKWNEEFQALTMTNYNEFGLQLKSYKRLDNAMEEYKNQLILGGLDYKSAVIQSTKQRVHARAIWFEAQEIGVKLKGIRQKIKFLEEELEFRRVKMARDLGMVSYKPDVRELD